MAVATTTFLTDTILGIRDLIIANVTDPISSKRSGRNNFVMTSFPLKDVMYPMITVRCGVVREIESAGQRSSIKYLQLPVEVRVWATSEVQKEQLTQQTINCLRSHQFGTGGTSDSLDLHDFKLASCVPVDEPGHAGIKSCVMTFEYVFAAGQ